MQTVVITDTSVLINFLVLDGIPLLQGLSSRRFVITEHVRAEVTEHYPTQLQRLEDAIAAGSLEEWRVDDVTEVKLFAQLTKLGLGVGECSAFAVAINRKLAIAVDDKRAVKKIRRLEHEIEILGTEEIVVLLIRDEVLTVEEADAIKAKWETEFSFRLTFESFQERI